MVGLAGALAVAWVVAGLATILAAKAWFLVGPLWPDRAPDGLLGCTAMLTLAATFVVSFVGVTALFL